MDSFIMKSGSAAGEGKQGGGGGAARVEKQDFRKAAGIAGIWRQPGKPQVAWCLPPRSGLSRGFPCWGLLLGVGVGAGAVWSPQRRTEVPEELGPSGSRFPKVTLW